MMNRWANNESAEQRLRTLVRYYYHNRAFSCSTYFFAQTCNHMFFRFKCVVNVESSLHACRVSEPRLFSQERPVVN